MAQTLSAAEANRTFSSVLRRVREGQSFIVTSHGRPVAKIEPVGAGDKIAGRAREALLRRLRAAPLRKADRWTRDELHERSQKGRRP
ncbi:MAG TPA: type II toxin-antitoxin system prevent-host-death family antitoxin [Vicinamibacterales bacterium]|nr:type II toxin-antitoxin system prevent-host-death family antitoxin [Vicinamibacterales bacterium]